MRSTSGDCVQPIGWLSIPMRGYEVIAPGVVFVAAAKLSIPMRGYEQMWAQRQHHLH